MDKYSPEEIADIQEREKKALEMLKELQLNPSAQVVKVNIGNDVFADRVIPYLADLKYKKDEPIKKIEEPVESK